MTLREYLEQMKAMIKANPDALDLQVVYGKDSEGNGFEPVHYSPAVGIYQPGGFTEFEAFSVEEHDPKQINAVCLN